MALIACKVSGAEGRNPVTVTTNGNWTLTNEAGTITITNSVPNPLTSGYTKVTPKQSGQMSINGTTITVTANQSYNITTDDTISMSASRQPDTHLGSFDVGPITFVLE